MSVLVNVHGLIDHNRDEHLRFVDAAVCEVAGADVRQVLEQPDVRGVVLFSDMQPTRLVVDGGDLDRELI